MLVIAKVVLQAVSDNLLLQLLLVDSLRCVTTYRLAGKWHRIHTKVIALSLVFVHSLAKIRLLISTKIVALKVILVCLSERTFLLVIHCIMKFVERSFSFDFNILELLLFSLCGSMLNCASSWLLAWSIYGLDWSFAWSNCSLGSGLGGSLGFDVVGSFVILGIVASLELLPYLSKGCAGVASILVTDKWCDNIPVYLCKLCKPPTVTVVEVWQNPVSLSHSLITGNYAP